MSKNLRDQSSSIERSARQKRYSAPPSFEQHAMYSAKGSSAPYNGEKQKKECNAISVERRAVRLLSRRYTLTATGYKFLEIGINVGPPSYVEIALGDHRGQELILSLETWKGLYEQRWNIYKLLLNDYKDNFISVGPLTVRICLMNDVTLVRLESLNVRVTMIESTLRRMFALNECIDVTFDRLVRFVDTIDTKYTRFSNIASVVTDPEERLSFAEDIRVLTHQETTNSSSRRPHYLHISSPSYSPIKTEPGSPPDFSVLFPERHDLQIYPDFPEDLRRVL
ncbi:hypothetical protein P5V15_010263 [Pogonomyrmex californicus]